MHEYHSHCIAEQRDSNEKWCFIFSPPALKMCFLRSSKDKSSTGKSTGVAEFVRLIDTIILTGKSIGEKTSPE